MTEKANLAALISARLLIRYAQQSIAISVLARL
jgi:hypothetical protein